MVESKGSRQMSELEACSNSSLSRGSQPTIEILGQAIEGEPRHLSALHEILVAQDGRRTFLQGRQKTCHNLYEHIAEPCLCGGLREGKMSSRSMIMTPYCHAAVQSSEFPKKLPSGYIL